MFKKILSFPGAALDFLFGLIKKHPMAAIATVWAGAIAAAAFWRLQQPFTVEQPYLVGSGLANVALGGLNLWLLKRDSQASAPKIGICLAVIAVGLVVGYFGVRVP